MKRAVAACWLAVLALGCRDEASLVESAKFGIFYGGQIQEREELPFQLDANKQQHGFRVVLRENAPEPIPIRWELSRPGPPRSAALPIPRPEDRVTELGNAVLPRGAREFEQRFSFSPGDALGMWNLRVTLDQRVLIDRPFGVYDAAARKHARQKSRIDAGK